MEITRPLSDLQDKFAEVCEAVRQSTEPILLTKEGQGDLVLMSLDAYENMQQEWEVTAKLLEAEKEEELNGGKYYTSEEVLHSLLSSIRTEKVV